MWVKICGTTNLEDALLAAEAGADAIGFVFAESPRRVEPMVVKRIVAELPESVEAIGVFVNETDKRIMEIAGAVGLSAAQVYGDRGWMGIRAEPGHTLEAIAVVGPEELPFAVEFRETEPFPRLVVDASYTRGGTGTRFQWESAAPMIHALREKNHEVIIAGGLTPDNVGEAIRILRPWGVDVVSGVEKSPGRKDPEKVRAFIAAARAAGDRL